MILPCWTNRAIAQQSFVIIEALSSCTSVTNVHADGDVWLCVQQHWFQVSDALFVQAETLQTDAATRRPSFTLPFSTPDLYLHFLLLLVLSDVIRRRGAADYPRRRRPASPSICRPGCCFSVTFTSTSKHKKPDVIYRRGVGMVESLEWALY